MLQLVYTFEDPPRKFSKSVFLAGPTPSFLVADSWRPRAIEILKKLGYDGVVFVPEYRRGDAKITAENEKNGEAEQIQWEHKCLDMADCIVFWVPRNLKTMPAFTTNVEFGLYAHLGKAVFGAPKGAPKNSYLRFVAKKFNIPQFNTLEETLDHAVQFIGGGALRRGGERDVPIHIWRLRAFQKWYENMRFAGNILEGAKLEWISGVRNNPEAIFCFAMQPNVRVASEKRNKINDPVIFRLDISSVILYKPAERFEDTKVILVKEFRTAVSNVPGFIWELPSGSSPNLSNPIIVARDEVFEKVGLKINYDRLRYWGERQLAGTICAHKAHLFSSELTDKELEWVYSQEQEGVPRGDGKILKADLGNSTGERLYVEVRTLKEIKISNLLDWSNLGMVETVLREVQGE